MSINKEQYFRILEATKAKNATLVAVSKTKSAGEIMELYELGQRDFGENYVQELVDKEKNLPKDIRWHFIGHLQSNKVKYLSPFIYLVHGVDNIKLLSEINKQGQKHNRVLDVLLQVHIAREETKFGFDEGEIRELFQLHPNGFSEWPQVNIKGLMGMASFSEDLELVRKELRGLYELYKQLSLANQGLSIISMGMSADFSIALEEGSSMVRVGSLIFGSRNKG
jgi:pyridoxal phosphate enzyme (YggS family)